MSWIRNNYEMSLVFFFYYSEIRKKKHINEFFSNYYEFKRLKFTPIVFPERRTCFAYFGKKHSQYSVRTFKFKAIDIYVFSLTEFHLVNFL